MAAPTTAHSQESGEGALKSIAAESRPMLLDALTPPRFDMVGIREVDESTVYRRHTVSGLAAGITVAAIALPLSLRASECRGSGNYLQLCRFYFLGATVVGGGLGALVGQIVRTESPRGRTTLTLGGSAVGAVGVFLASVAACGQERSGNPALLCGPDGMVEPGTVAAGAVVGGIAGYLLGGRSENLRVSRFGPEITPGGQRAMAVGFTLPW